MAIKEDGVWIYAELNEDGSVQKDSLDLLAPAAKIAEMYGKDVVVVFAGQETGTAVSQLLEYGVHGIIAVIEIGKAHPCDLAVEALTNLSVKYSPYAILMASTDAGREIGPRLAARLKTGISADCIKIGFDKKTDDIVWTRQVYEGLYIAETACARRPQIATVRRGVFKARRVDAASTEVVFEKLDTEAIEIQKQILEVVKKLDEKEIDLQEAEVVVTGGRGVGSKEGFEIIKDFAHLMGAAVGATRPVVEAGWTEKHRQVGQTGKTVTPRIYIACGVAGAVQHLVGMRNSDTIIAINKNPRAPIFYVADYGIVGDLFKVLPALAEEIKRDRLC